MIFIRRRRPILRAAAVGGVAYHMGKSAQSGRDQDEAQEQRIQELEDEKNYSQVANPVTKDMAEKIDELKALHDSGALTDEEFTAAKKKLLEG